MLNLISYWGVITSLTFILVISLLPIIMPLANHALKTISNGELGTTYASHVFLKFTGLTNACGQKRYGTKQDGFSFDCFMPAGILSLSLWGTVSAIILQGGVSLLTLVTTIANNTHEGIAFVFIGIIGYFGFIKLGKIIYKLSSALSKLEAKGDSND